MSTTSDMNPRPPATGLPAGTVCVRSVASSDTDALVALHRRLSPRALRCRFLTTHPDLSPETIGRLTDVDGHDRVTFVAALDGLLVGVAGYERRGDTDDALVKLVADDSARAQDVEVVLLDRLVTVARREGFQRLLLRVSPIDRELIERLDDSPFDSSRHYHSGIVTITLRLDPLG